MWQRARCAWSDSRSTPSRCVCNGKSEAEKKNKCVADHFVAHLLDWRLGIADPVRGNRPDVVVVALQESASDSELMNGPASAFAQALSRRGYVAPGNPEVAEALGYGLTTFTKRTMRGLRLGIFVREELAVRDGARLGDPWTHFCGSSLGLDNRPWMRDTLKSKGGLVRSLVLGDAGGTKLTFVDVHLPFTSSSFKGCAARAAALAYQSECFERLYADVLERENPDYVFVLGDLNYRLSPFEVEEEGECADEAPQRVPEETLRLLNAVIEGNQRWQALHRIDELQRHRAEHRLPMEGIGNRGPEFAPTCKMCKGRSAGCPVHGAPLCDRCGDAGTKDACQVCYAVRQGSEARYLGWCDRILYASRGNDVRCTDYDRYDHGNMVLSDHAGVVGVYELEGAQLMPRLIGKL